MQNNFLIIEVNQNELFPNEILIEYLHALRAFDVVDPLNSRFNSLTQYSNGFVGNY